MYKFIFLFLLASLYTLAEPIKFKEEKFINAIQISTYRNGLMNINSMSIEIIYPKENKSFIFNKENIIEKKGNEEKILLILDSLHNLVFFLYFLLFQLYFLC